MNKAKAAKSDKARKPPTDFSRPANSTRAATFYAGLDPSTKNKRSKVTDATRRVDNNANIALQTQRSGSLRRRGKENAGGDVAVASLHPKAVTSRRESDPSKEKAQSSTLSLNNLLRHQPKTAQNQSSKPKRPTTVPNQVFLKRGHKEGPNQQDNLSRTSSITNLDSLESNFQGKGAKPRKAPSKERIDKQGQDGRKAKNNNKLEPPTGQPLSYSSDSLQEVELHQLRKQLREMADEKSSLALQLGEQRGQLNVLQKEILKLKSFQEESNVEMEKLAEENNVLRNRLRDVAHSPLSDNEKQQLLFENRHHSSAPASIATNVPDENGGDVTTCTTPDWDKHSSGNVSEVSVACLQDKINQMQETHYSTNEELQATLQELTDLQRQLTELQQENERLSEEKTLMFDSLCRQTERLNDSRQEVENLKQLLYRERQDETGTNQFESAVEREQKLVELLRSAQEEREQLLLKMEQLQADLHESRAGNIEKTEAIAQLSERVRTLECTLDAKHAEHKQLDQELAQAKDQSSGKQIEIDRLADLLENARTKINELEQDRTLSDKSELDELLDNARKEKDQLESEISYLKEHLARSKNENEKLKEQVFVLQEECKVTRNNAKTTQNDLEYKCEKLASEKASLSEQLQQFQEAVNELQVQAQCHLEDKRQLSAVLSETQRNMSEAERKNMTMENELQELRKLRAEENDEWEKFQNDLLTSVRVANDFKTEAQQQLQNFILENKTYRERVRLLEGQLEKLKGEKTSTSTQTDTILTPQIIAIARNLDPVITNRISLLEHPDPKSPVGSPKSMEKFFPILSKERRSKSRDNLAESSSESSSKRAKERKSSLKKSRSRDDLTVAPEEPLQEPKGLFKRSKSKDNVQESGEEDGKGSRGFMKWYKSKDHVDLDPTKGALKKSRSKEKVHEVDGAEKPRKSKDSIDSSSDSNKSESKPEFLSKFIKKRDKSRYKPGAHQKFMSVEEEMLLKSLDSWYEHIDHNVPDELLTEEDRAVKRLKTLYEDDVLKERPVAHKPKDSLAISKPLLNSVVLNPKLERFFRDPKLPSVDGEVRQSALEDVYFALDSKERTPDEALPKSRSMQDINVFEEFRTESELAPVTNSQPIPANKVYNRMSSEIHPNDSVSNPRYSTDHLLVNQLPQPRIYVNYENLDEIIGAIPKDLPEKELSEEQRFALKLKQALDEAEKQTTLKRLKKKKSSIRGVEISAPTQESVQKNWKLKEVLMNPKIRRAEYPTPSGERKRHSTDICSDLGSPSNTPTLTKATSKSHEDISFSFIPENTLINMYYASQQSKESSSSSSFTSAEFNLDTGKIVEKCDIPFKLQTVTVIPDSREDLLYNDTLNKTRNKEGLAELKQQLSDEDVHHPKIIEARANYRHELQKVLKRIEHDELRKSLRKQRSQDDLRELPVVDAPKVRRTVPPSKPNTLEIDAGLMDVAFVAPPQGYEDEEQLTQKPELHYYNYESAKAISIDASRGSSLLQEPEDAIPQQWVSVEELHFQTPTLIDAEEQDLKLHLDWSHADVEESPDNEEGEEGTHALFLHEGLQPPHQKYPSEGELDWQLPPALHLVEESPSEKGRHELLTLHELVEHLQRRTIRLGPPVDLQPEWQMPHVSQSAEATLHFEDVDKQHPKQEEPLKSPAQVSHPVEEVEESQHVLSLHEDVTRPRQEESWEEPTEAKLGWQVAEVRDSVGEKPQHTSTLHQGLRRQETPKEGKHSATQQESLEHPLEAELECFIEEERKHSLSVHDDFRRPPQEESLEHQLEGNLQWQVADVGPIIEEIPSIGEQPQIAEAHWEVPLISESSGMEETIKENQYGVVSPLEIRSCYRTVVKEYKSRFHQEEPEPEPEPNHPNHDPAIGDFFRTAFNNSVEAVREDEESALRRSEAISSIDEEMDAIMGRYMHTTASLLVQTSLVPETLPNVHQMDDMLNAEPLSLEDQQLIEEMKAKYDRSDTLSTNSERSDVAGDQLGEEAGARLRPSVGKKAARPLSELNEADLLLIDMARRQSADVEETDIVPPLPNSPKPQQVEVALVENPVKWQSVPSLQPRNPADSNVVMRNSPPNPRTSKRLSDLMFTETIFVPIAPTPELQPPTPPKYKQDGHFKEQVFVAPLPVAHEPVYSNVGFKTLESPKAAYKGAIKKPLPLPRDNLAGPRALDVADFDKMSEAELNSSRVGDKEANVRGESTEDPIWVEESKAHTDIVSKLEESPVELKASGEEARAVQEENDVEEIAPNSSNVNLFHMDSPLSYDSYLELFKSDESKEFEALLGKRPETRPKIVDFVPLDDKTTSVFTQENNSYDTLEREKTFHVLEQAATITKPDASSSLEVLAQKSSTSASKSSSTSRTSFSQAKKLFEALAEANKEEKPRPKPNRLGGRDSKSWQQLKQKPSKETIPDLPTPDSKDH
uniref:Uncharacterized protein n=1 Tax=Dendroctonus ponderosae TaxID=77166 RepID=A0AAR5Q490_DENPD